MPIALIPIVTAIITAIGAVVGTIVETGKAVLDTLLSVFQNVFSLLQSFMQSAPTPMKIVVFLFFVLTFGNVFSNFFLGTKYACDANNILYQTDNIGTALVGVFKTQFQGMSEADRITFLQQNYEQGETPASPTRVKCVDAKPRLLFYSIDVLSYKLWMLLLVALMGIPLILSYYRTMGVLGG